VDQGPNPWAQGSGGTARPPEPDPAADPGRRAAPTATKDDGRHGKAPHITQIPTSDEELYGIKQVLA